MKKDRHIAVITGATSGIGKAFAREFAGRGLDLILTGRRKDELRKTTEAISGQFHVRTEVFLGDLSDPDNRRALCRMIRQTGNIDVLVNNAGFGIDRPFHELSPEEIRSMIGTHVEATTEITCAVLPEMIRRRRGIIINVSSLGAFIPGVTRTLYLATKSYIHYFTESLALEARPFGIRVQSLCPGMTSTDFHRDLSGEELKRRQKFLRFMDPEEVVSQSLKGLDRGWVLCIPGTVNKLYYILAKCLPSGLLGILSHWKEESLSPEGIPGSSRKMPAALSVPMRGISGTWGPVQRTRQAS